MSGVADFDVVCAYVFYACCTPAVRNLEYDVWAPLGCEDCSSYFAVGYVQVPVVDQLVHLEVSLSLGSIFIIPLFDDSCISSFQVHPSCFLKFGHQSSNVFFLSADKRGSC